MRVLIIDFDNTGLDIAWRAAEAGHEVRWWLPPNVDRSPVRTGDGFPGIVKVPKWQDSMKWAKDGIILNLFNDRKITAELDKWRSFGFPVFGPTTKSAALEINRGLGMSYFEKFGFEVPAYHTFPTIDAALSFAWKAQDPYVLKPMGDDADKSLTYVASDPADLVSFLEQKKRHGAKVKGELMLQEKVNLIMEVGISAWMGKEGFLAPRNVNVEHKKLMNEDFGPNTGEQGTLCKYFTDTKDSILADALAKFEPDLVKLGHTGDFDIGGAIDEKGRFVPFEVSARMGWPSTFILLQCHKGDPVEWMKAALDGDDILEVDERCAVGVVMAKPPYPNKNEHPADSVGSVVTGIEDVWDQVSPVELMIETGPVMRDGKVSRGPVYKTTGDYICCVTGLGSDVHDAIAKAYGAVEHIKYQDRMVRTDIAKALEKKLPKAQALGFNELPDF